MRVEKGKERVNSKNGTSEAFSLTLAHAPSIPSSPSCRIWLT